MIGRLTLSAHPERSPNAQNAGAASLDVRERHALAIPAFRRLLRGGGRLAFRGRDAELASLGIKGEAIFKSYTYFQEAPADDRLYREEGILRLEWTRQFAPWIGVKAVGRGAGRHGRRRERGLFRRSRHESPPEHPRASARGRRAFRWAPVDVTIGKQFFAWGTADAYNPTDNLNPYDYLDVLDTRQDGRVLGRGPRPGGADEPGRRRRAGVHAEPTPGGEQPVGAPAAAGRPRGAERSRGAGHRAGQRPVCGPGPHDGGGVGSVGELLRGIRRRARVPRGERPVAVRDRRREPDSRVRPDPGGGGGFLDDRPGDRGARRSRRQVHPEERTRGPFPEHRRVHVHVGRPRIPVARRGQSHARVRRRDRAFGSETRRSCRPGAATPRWATCWPSTPSRTRRAGGSCSR